MCLANAQDDILRGISKKELVRMKLRERQKTIEWRWKRSYNINTELLLLNGISDYGNENVWKNVWKM